MAIQAKNKIDPSFNMSSMTDIVFLLLIFFMLTSNFATPTGLPISLPKSANSQKEVTKVKVTITKDLQYYVNEVPTAESRIEDKLKEILPSKNGSVTLFVDKDVPVEYLVKVASTASKLNAKVSVATQKQ
ncbi:ExbD/TolR family protein [Sediminitomix flava]|uniref:Outer membrane transport energization protein ExbD n=1 Tax=Sediminitomix flava TaxID=379075 RepID=A0A315ZAC5_SEDFL|nr:biopolymer transporter ExbD [Sediminitomix flava]PWJ42290.1 outer membrane transport energization protein ExbD [Sediminitomix flava]